MYAWCCAQRALHQVGKRHRTIPLFPWPINTTLTRFGVSLTRPNVSLTVNSVTLIKFACNDTPSEK